jgi:hypothetical protein
MQLLRSGGVPPEFRRVDDYHFMCRWGSLWPKPVTRRYIGDALNNTCTDVVNASLVNVLLNMLGNVDANSGQ